MLGHLRGLTNPLRGTDYAAKADRAGQRGNPTSRAPVPADLLDAADYLLTLLWSTAEVIEGRMPRGRVQVPVGAGVPVLVDYARDLLGVILEGLPMLSRQPEIVPLVDAVVGRPASSEEWTVRTVLERWSVREDPWWAAQPCPLCGARSIKVTPPPAPGDEITYECKLCEWCAPEDVDGFWAEVFSRGERRAA